MPENRTKVAETAETLKLAEEDLIVALEINDPALRPKKLAVLHRWTDCMIRHHNAIEEAKRNSARRT